MHTVLVAFCQKQQIIDELFHMLCFTQNGINGFLQYIWVALSPTVDEACIALDDGNGCPQFMRSVRHKLILSVERLL